MTAVEEKNLVQYVMTASVADRLGLAGAVKQAAATFGMSEKAVWDVIRSATGR